MTAENDTWTRGDMVERLRLNDKGITDVGEVPQVPPLRNYRELQNDDVMQIFKQAVRRKRSAVDQAACSFASQRGTTGHNKEVDVRQ